MQTTAPASNADDVTVERLRTTTSDVEPSIDTGFEAPLFTIASRSAGRIPGLVLAAVLTAPVRYFNPHLDALRAGTYSYVFRQRHGRRLSLREACELATKAFDESERRLREDRMAELAMFASIWGPLDSDR